MGLWKECRENYDRGKSWTRHIIVWVRGKWRAGEWLYGVHSNFVLLMDGHTLNGWILALVKSADDVGSGEIKVILLETLTNVHLYFI